MNERIDVLAVMDDAVNQAVFCSETYPGPGRDRHMNAIKEARAAVAELIEATANLVHEWDADYSGHSRFDPSEGKHWEEVEGRFRDAIARVTTP